MGLILDGEKRECLVPVIDWNVHGYNFNDVASTQLRRIKPELVMLHWTGGENGVNGLCRTLRARGIGVSFFIDRSGVVYQLVDPVIRDPRDVGGYHGRRTISIEIANYGFVIRGRKVLRSGRDRVTDRERIHGMRLDIARFYTDQVTAVKYLVECLCNYLEIPLVLPRESDGRLALRRLSSREMRGFRGVCGHFHKTEKKVDPGFLLFHILDELWFGGKIPERYGYDISAIELYD